MNYVSSSPTLLKMNKSKENHSNPANLFATINSLRSKLILLIFAIPFLPYQFDRSTQKIIVNTTTSSTFHNRKHWGCWIGYIVSCC